MTTTAFEDVIDRFVAASAGFEQRLRTVKPDQWAGPTPCTDWDVKALTNHMARANLNFAALAADGSAAEFVRQRDADALGDDPVQAYARSVQTCTGAFARPHVTEMLLDYPLRPVTGAQALAIRTTDTVIHTWDLARAIGAGEDLDPGLVAWVDEHLDAIYAGLPEMPTSERTTHRFFAAPGTPPPDGASRQARLLHLTGRTP